MMQLQKIAQHTPLLLYRPGYAGGYNPEAG